MPTPIFVCGAECGLAAIGTVTPAGIARHWSSVTGTPTVVTSGPTPMLSSKCYRFNAVAGQSSLQHTFATAVASPATLIASFDIWFTTLPASAVTFWKSVAAANYGVGYDPASGEIRPMLGTLSGTSGVAVTTGRWYHIDIKIVHAATTTIDIMVDGVALPQRTTSASASTVSGHIVGWSQQNVTADCYIDNIEVSATGADYPIGVSTVVGLYPNGDKTNSVVSPGTGNLGHIYAAVANFGKGAGGNTNLAAQNVESTSWQSLQDPLSTTIPTNFISGRANTSSEQLVWFLDDLPGTALTVDGTMLVVTSHSAAATANNLTVKVSNAANFTLSADLSEITIVAAVLAQSLNPPGSAPLTVADINAAFVAFASSDVNPDVYLDGICLEVAYVPESGLSGSISPALFTLSPVALSAIGSGDASRTLTSAALTFSPVALVRSVGTATASISPATLILNPTALTGQATIDPQFASISPVVMTLNPQPVVTSIGGVSRSVSPVTISLSPVTLIRSVGDVSRTLGIVTVNLIPIALTRSVGGVSISISSVTLTFTPVALTRGTDTSARTITPVTVSLVIVSLNTLVGTVSQTLSPVVLTLTPVALVPLVLVPQFGSIGPVVFTLSPVSLTKSVGGVTTSVSPALFTLSAVAITRSVGTVTISISPASVSLIPIILTRSVGGTASVSIGAAIFTLTTVALTKSVGGATTSVSPVVLTFTAVTITRTLGTTSSSISPVIISLTTVVLTTSIGGVTRSISPVTLTFIPFVITGFITVPGVGNISPVVISLIPVALNRSVGGVTTSVSPVILTFTAVVLTRSVGTSTYTITPITLTISPTSLTCSVGGVSMTINPAILTLIAFALSPIFGGNPKVWNGFSWVEKPTKYWTGSVWVEKPMKVWTGSQWVLV